MNHPQPSQPPRGRRRDFERNREAILVAAAECFTQLGPRTSIELIARRAKLSPVTIYRHFPTRGDLERAVFEIRLDEYADAILRAQDCDDSRAAFRRTIQAIVSMQARDRSFRDLIDGDPQRLSESPGLSRFIAAFFGALERAREHGVIREDVQNEDVMLLLLATEGIARTASNLNEPALNRAVDILVDGVCGDRSELSGSAMDWSQLIDATRG